MPPARLSPLDASFLAVESPTAHMHVGWAAVFDPPPGREPPGFDELSAHIGRRLGRAPRYRQLLEHVPLDVNAPVWVDDPGFDLSRHVLPARSPSLGETIDECMSEPLPRDRPLWQLRIAPRLDDGRLAVVGKAHHCMVDGVAAVELASLLLDPSADAADPQADDWEPAPAPGRIRLLADGLTDLARRELDLASLPARVMSSPRRAREASAGAARAARALVDAARPGLPSAVLNEPISSRRHLGLLARPLDDLLRIRSRFEVKLNDVVLAVTAGGVRNFLRGRGEESPPLKTMVPVSLRTPDQLGELGNRLSFMFVDLPCDEPDPVRRLRDVHAATAERKQAGGPEGGAAVLEWIGFAPGRLQRLASRLIASPRAFNLVVSNIPGPRGRLYMRGCPLVEAYPVVPLADRHALSVGLTTIGDGAFFGLYCDRRALPDADDLAGEIDASIDELLERAEGGRFRTAEGLLVGEG